MYVSSQSKRWIIDQPVYPPPRRLEWPVLARHRRAPARNVVSVLALDQTRDDEQQRAHGDEQEPTPGTDTAYVPPKLCHYSVETPVREPPCVVVVVGRCSGHRAPRFRRFSVVSITRRIATLRCSRGRQQGTSLGSNVGVSSPLFLVFRLAFLPPSCRCTPGARNGVP